MRISGSVFVVTGGGNGIGRELVLTLLERGASAAAVDVRADDLAQLMREVQSSDRLSTHVVDITDQAAVERLPDAVLAAHGAVDGLVNCAGIIQPFVRVNDLPMDAIERVMRVNFFGAVAMCKAFLPHLLARPCAHILNVASMGAFVPVPGQTVYGASKAALALFSEGLRSELAGTGVGVTVAYPGATRTRISEHSGVAVSGDAEQSAVPMTEPRDAARTMVEAIERDAYRVLVGRDARVMDVMRRLSPERAAAMIQRRMGSLLDR